MKSTALLCTSIATLGLLGSAAMLTAGPLDPPAGPVAPTYKTLQEVEPRIPLSQTSAPGDSSNQYRITQPGSYYLTGNITGEAGKTCIYISTSRVTLDLNGFTIQAVSGSTIGIRATGNSGLAIRNGTVHDFMTCIDVQETNGVRLSNLCTSAGTIGFRIGFTAVVTDCTSVDNTTGFTVFSTSSLTRCSARGGTRGFDVGKGSTLTDCSALVAETGFYLQLESVLTRCSARESVNHGFNIQESSVLTDCIAYDNGGIGFFATARSRLVNCVARANSYGFSMVEGNSLVECTAASNTIDGLFIDGNSNTVERSTFHENERYGINLFRGFGNSIDGNLLSYNGDIGLNVNVADNFAVRNRARGNGNNNYLFATGADYGIIISNPGAGFNSSSAWANFAY